MSTNIERRIKELEAMHTIMEMANDEDYYDTWVACGWIPDCASYDDLRSIAEVDEEFYETVTFFTRLMKQVLNDGGLYSTGMEKFYRKHNTNMLG